MATRRSPQIASRKAPQQARSTELVAAILQAAVQVLKKEGAQRFTTARVAEKAGVSVGSVYQYFPNKAAILFQLQSDEWRQTGDMLGGVLSDSSKPPLERLRIFIHVFIKSECEEAKMRIALNDAAPLYRNTPEARKARSAIDHIVDTFMREVLPDVAEPQRALAGDLIATTFSSVGKHFSGKPRTAEEIEAYANAMTEMFSAYLASLARLDTRKTPLRAL